MGRVIAIGPGGRAQAPARDDRYRPIIDWVRGAGLLDVQLPGPLCGTRDQADDVRRGLHRSARYYCSCGQRNCTRKYPNTPHESNPAGGCPAGGQRISCRAGIAKEGNRWRVNFTLHDKQEAIRAVVAKHGPDPNKWPYYARRKQLKED